VIRQSVVETCYLDDAAMPPGEPLVGARCCLVCSPTSHSGDDAHCVQHLTANPAKTMEMAFGFGPITAGTVLPATVPRGPGSIMSGDVGAVVPWGLHLDDMLLS
jgi:hypothetical protein